MDVIRRRMGVCFLLVLACSLGGCNTKVRGNQGQLPTYPLMPVEAQWIRNGEPIEFEGKLWYPQDGVESLLDSEVYYVGEYREVQYFIDKIDVRPYDRLYTKFSKNQFRYFKKRGK